MKEDIKDNDLSKKFNDKNTILTQKGFRTYGSLFPI